MMQLMLAILILPSYWNLILQGCASLASEPASEPCPQACQ